MRLLFEECLYSTVELGTLGLGDFVTTHDGSLSKCSFVGYYRRRDMIEPVFVLPKVFVAGGQALSRYDPQSLALGPAASQLSTADFNFVKGFAEKLFFALKRYRAERAKGNVSLQQGSAIRSNIGDTELTSFEAMLSLIDFNRANPYLHVNEREVAASRAPRLIDWKKTFNRHVILFEGEFPLAFELEGRSPQWNRSDPLLVIYYTLLREFAQYDPSISTDPSVPPLDRKDFARLTPKVAHLLRNRRGVYYSDKLKRLHALLLSYFAADSGSLSAAPLQYLVAESFQNVFERLVDALLSDEDLLARYKQLRDGKAIDHLFGERDVFRTNRIIFIGDSKYYKDPAEIAPQKHKQFTYARNIIQENIYVLNRGGQTLYSRNYRDPLTEGYNVTPNFFIFGVVDPHFRESISVVEADDQTPEFTCHFHNRLFDRDTLHVLYFKADLLRLLYYYVATRRGLSPTSLAVRQRARSVILSSLATYLNHRYSFYRTKPSKRFIAANFRQLIGKVFMSPSTSPECVLALERSGNDENLALLTLMQRGRVPVAPFTLDESLDFQ